MYPVRKCLILLAFAVLGFACTAKAAGKTVGVVLSADLPRYQEAYKSFTAELAKAGYGAGKAEVYLQAPNPDMMSWTNSVRKFVGVGADVIVTFGAAATQTAVREAGNIPVVYAFVYDPQACGFVNANTTGVSSKVPMITLLKTLKTVTPFSRLAVVYNPDEKGSAMELEEAKKNSSGLGYQVNEVGCTNSGQVKGKVSAVLGSVDAVFVSGSAVVGMSASGIISAAGKSKKPVITMSPDYVDKGALLTLAPTAAEQGALAASLAAKVLSGSPPSSLPVESSRKVDLVLNLKSATALELKVPFDVLNAATQVIK